MYWKVFGLGRIREVVSTGEDAPLKKGKANKNTRKLSLKLLNRCPIIALE
ncbi:MAG: hypothetical protein ACJAWH_000349 [Maribacter sp.]|jgi:hypothetical protein